MMPKNTLFTTHEHMEKLRLMGVATVHDIASRLTLCGQSLDVEPKLMEAYRLGYEAGKLHKQKEAQARGKAN
jgi:hypothetical protein